MGDGPQGIEVFPDHFQASTSGVDSIQSKSSSISHPRTDFQHNRSHSRLWSRRKLKGAATMLNLFSLRGLPWGSGTDGQEKVVITAAEVESLRSDIADLEEREAHLKAQSWSKVDKLGDTSRSDASLEGFPSDEMINESPLKFRLEHLDEILRSARLSGYLYMRTRWAALPGEPPPIDDTEVDDWLPRFVVLHGSCIFLYLLSTDLSPQDSTLLSDVVEVAPLPCFTRENEETRHCFFILTRHGLRYECSSASKIQVDSWLTALQADCKLGSDANAMALHDSREM